MQIVSANDYLTREERKLLMQKNAFLAWRDIGIHYLWIIAAFSWAYTFPNVFSILLALFVLGGKQLACAILMHDTSHHAVFSNKKWNDVVGQWLGAYPVFNNMKAYRPYHYRHHASNGLEEDPDLLLTRGYPTSRKSMMRKFFRDLSGQTGVKALIGLVMMQLGYLEFNLGGKVVRVSQKERSWKGFWRVFKNNLLGPIVANLIIFLLLSLLASPWLYLLWIGAYLTTFQFCLRVRSMAEHSVLEDRTDPYKNTRTTKANFLEKMLFAPYNVNYHAEHHMLMGVPPYKLPAMHKLLKERDFFSKGVMAPNYMTIIRSAIVD
ncbi:MAG: fatty acid desaturase family protein [Bacteroidota bacterium]